MLLYLENPGNTAWCHTLFGEKTLVQSQRMERMVGDYLNKINNYYNNNNLPAFSPFSVIERGSPDALFGKV
jgi:hypothetical protein